MHGQLIRNFNLIRFYELSYLNIKGKPIIAILELFNTVNFHLNSNDLRLKFNELIYKQISSKEQLLSILSNIAPDCTIRLIESQQFINYFKNDALNSVVFNNVRFICAESMQPFVGLLRVYANNTNLQDYVSQYVLEQRNNQQDQYQYIDNLYTKILNYHGDIEIVITLAIARRGGFSWKLCRSSKNLTTAELEYFSNRELIE